MMLLLTSDDESSFEFFLKAEFTSHLYVHITLATDTEAPASCFAQLLQDSQNILKLKQNILLFKRHIPWNRMLRGHVNLVICLY